MSRIIAAQTGIAFVLDAGQALELTDLCGAQVADVTAFGAHDRAEYFSAGRTLDYNERVYLSTGDRLYSNRSRPLFEIELDDAGRHDYLLTPCSERMFELLRGERGHPSCLSNLARALEPFGLGTDDVHATFNAFMNVELAPDGRIRVAAPKSKAGDRVVLRALEDVVVAVSACSSEQSNDGSCKPIGYRILDRP